MHFLYIYIYIYIYIISYYIIYTEKSVQEESIMILNIFSPVFAFKFNQFFCHIDVGISDVSSYFIILIKLLGPTIRKIIQQILQGEQWGYRSYLIDNNSGIHQDSPCILYLINNVSQKVTVSPWPHGVWVTFAHNYYLVYSVYSTHVCMCWIYGIHILFYLLWSLVKRRGVRLKKWK